MVARMLNTHHFTDNWFFAAFFQQLRSFKRTVDVDPSYHPKIIGRKGAVISRIRMDNDVVIQFPEKGDPSQQVITITGYEENTAKAKDDILKIVRDLVSYYMVARRYNTAMIKVLC